MSSQQLISLFLLILLFIFGCLCGCIETDTNDAKDNDIQYDIMGSWFRLDTFNNITYNISYQFFSNQTFFSGVKNVSEDSYEISIRGTYSISNDTITLTTSNPTASSSLRFAISEDKQSLLLYYDDQINFDVYIRVE